MVSATRNESDGWPPMPSLFSLADHITRTFFTDVFNMAEYIKDCHGFTDDDIVYLLDDGEHTEPTAANILEAFKTVASEAQPGDACFIHYSGHGCSIRDDDGDEEDGKDEALCPVDYPEAGVLRDDDVFEMLIAPMPRGVTLTCIMDCCQ